MCSQSSQLIMNVTHKNVFRQGFHPFLILVMCGSCAVLSSDVSPLAKSDNSSEVVQGTSLEIIADVHDLTETTSSPEWSTANYETTTSTPNTYSTFTPSLPGLESNAAFDLDHDERKSLEKAREEKLGHVKKRAIRSLMQIFGMGEDALHNRSSDDFGPAPDFMIDLYNTITDTYGVTRAKNPYGAHVIRSFMERDSRKYDYFFFNMSSNQGESVPGGKLRDTERIVEAELHLYRNPTPHDRLHPSLYLTPFYILSLYQVVDSRNLAIPDLHKLLGVHYVPALGSGWEVFNVTQTVSEWIKGEKPNLGFIVAATSLGGDRVPVTFSRRNDHAPNAQPTDANSPVKKGNKQPILVLFNHDTEVEELNRRMKVMMTPSDSENQNSRSRNEKGRALDTTKERHANNDENNDEDNSAPVLPNIPNSSLENPRFHHSLLYQETIRHPNSVGRFRSRRSKNQTEPNGESQDTSTSSSVDHASSGRNLTSCGKHDLFISFEAIGWSSWIISPKGYNAYYCAGPCVFPLSHEVTPTNHATLLSIAHELALAPDVGRPCCVPTKLLPISLLYYDDDDNVVLKQYVDMVADTCGCH